MSQENVEIVRASFEAWNAGDMDAWGRFLAPDVISRVPENWPESGPFVGREAVVRQIQQQRETFGADAAEPIKAMSQENVEFVGNFYAMHNRGDAKF